MKNGDNERNGDNGSDGIIRKWGIMGGIWIMGGMGTMGDSYNKSLLYIVCLSYVRTVAAKYTLLPYTLAWTLD